MKKEKEALPQLPTPQHDYILVKEAHREFRKGSIIMPNVEDPTGNVRAGDLWEVVAVGPGPWTDRVGPNGEFLRRPICCKVGDIISFQGKGFGVNVDGGGQFGAIQDYQVVVIYPAVQPVEEQQHEVKFIASA